MRRLAAGFANIISHILETIVFQPFSYTMDHRIYEPKKIGENTFFGFSKSHIISLLLSKTAARQKTYTEFDTKRNETDETKIKEQLELANQVASLLRHNLAQAVQTDDKPDVFSLKLTPEHELGDNETLRQASKLRRLRNAEKGGDAKSSGGGCGSPSCCSN